MRVRSLAAVVVALSALVLVACGGEDDFENNPRPPAPIELTALIADNEVRVSPSTASKVGAGLATITISNQSQEPAVLLLEGPIDDESGEIVPGGTGDMKLELEEGSYRVSAQDSDARSSKLEVGPERKSSQNDLLLP